MNSNDVQPNLSSFNVIVTREEFNLFHNIDRQLFTRLVVRLQREISQSIKVMAFIMWIERKSKDYNLIAKILLGWPDAMLNNLADEVFIILKFIESSRDPNASPSERNFPMIQHILRHNVTLDFFHGKRFEIISEVTKFINNVCVRAFKDIIELVQYERGMNDQDQNQASVYGANPHIQPQMVYYGPNGVPMVPQQIVWPPQGSNNAPTEPNEISEILAKLKFDDIYNAPIGDDDNGKKEISPIDERTLFMTFSKGYPISENEIQEFFTRTFGDIIDRLIMQETNGAEQSLYARLVVRREANDVIDHFLEYKPRKKFSINGKHVWARKYIRKQPQPFEAIGTSR